MPIFATFEQQSFFGACPNVSRTPPSSPGAGVLGGGQLKTDCCCQDTSFGGVFDLPPLTDDTEAYPKGSVQARLDAFLASKGAARKGCHATEMAGGGFAWVTDSDRVSFISDGRLSLALQGTAEGLEGEENDKDDMLSGAEVRSSRDAWREAIRPAGGTPGAPDAAPGTRRECRAQRLVSASVLLSPARRCAAPPARCVPRRIIIVGGGAIGARGALRASGGVTEAYPSNNGSPVRADAGVCGAQRSAWSILGYYYEHAEHDLDVLKSELVAGLSSLSGQWAFVLHDRKRHRVVAAASKDGSVGLQWGCVRRSSGAAQPKCPLVCSKRCC